MLCTIELYMYILLSCHCCLFLSKALVLLTTLVINPYIQSKWFICTYEAYYSDVESVEDRPSRPCLLIAKPTIPMHLSGEVELRHRLEKAVTAGGSERP